MNYTTSTIDTPLGPMIAVADEELLYLLEFTSERKLEAKLERLGASMIPGNCKPIEQVRAELDAYFAGHFSPFQTPIRLTGTPFQNGVWEALKKIPLGTTCSYLDLAIAVGKPTAFRAVAQANGANNFPILIPCHRVINSNGELGGYSSGLRRKKWLLSHEQSAAKTPFFSP